MWSLLFIVTFHVAPSSLTSSPESVEATEGDPVQLDCSYSGMEAPVTHVQWLKDGEALKETGGPMRHKISDRRGNVTLRFKSVHLTDKGNYSCEIITKGFPSLISRSAALVVREKLKFSPPPVDKKLELGSTVKVSCKAQGTTNPTVRWIKEGEGEEFPKHVQDVNGTLHFNGVVEEDKGRYTCIASNVQGSINHTIDIEVVSKFTILFYFWPNLERRNLERSIFRNFKINVIEVSKVAATKLLIR